MTLSFFGTKADVSQIWLTLFEVPGMRILEGYSVPDQANRWFATSEEIRAYLDGGGWNLAAWPETVGARPNPEWITFTADAQRELGGKGRFALHSPAMIRIVSNNDQAGCLASTTMSSWTEKGARQRSILSQDILEEVDWKKFRSIVGKIERSITKSAPAKLGPCPVMPDAFRKFESGEIKLWNWGEECAYPSPLVLTA